MGIKRVKSYARKGKMVKSYTAKKKDKGYSWRMKLQKNYSSLDELKDYDENYGVVKRLGFKSAEEAWKKNPLIQGSTNPGDFRRSPTKKKNKSKLVQGKKSKVAGRKKTGISKAEANASRSASEDNWNER